MNYSEKSYSELCREESKLRIKYNEIEDDSVRNGLSFDAFTEKSKDVAEKLYFISKFKRLKQDPNVTYGKEWNGITLTLDKFKTLVLNDAYTDEDGYGYYATETSKSDVIIKPSDVSENLIRTDFTYVIWFENYDV